MGGWSTECPGDSPPCDSADELARLVPAETVSEGRSFAAVPAGDAAGGDYVPAGSVPPQGVRDADEPVGSVGVGHTRADVSMRVSARAPPPSEEEVLSLVRLRGVPRRVIELGYEPAAGYYSPSNPLRSEEMEWDLSHRITSARKTTNRPRLWCSEASAKIWKLYGETKNLKELPEPAPTGAWRQAANLMDTFLALRDIRKMFVSPYIEHTWLVYPFANPGIPQDDGMNIVMFHGGSCMGYGARHTTVCSTRRMMLRRDMP